MLIVQTFWSKPLTWSTINRSNSGLNGGWLTPMHFYMGWVLSFLSLSKIYKDITLVTDRFGKQLLIDQLQLDYTKTICCLDSINTYNKDLWAVPKLYSYSLQNEPFLHVDGDVFIWKPFFEKNHKTDVVVQNIEYDVAGCQELLHSIHKNFRYIPASLKNIDSIRNINFVNAGVLGGYDINFLIAYAEEGMSFVSRNIHCLGLIDQVKFNLIFEQHLLYCMFTDQMKTITEILPKKALSTCEFHLLPKLNGYIHLGGEYKRDTFNCSQVAFQLKLNFPEHYKIIIEFLTKKYGKYELKEFLGTIEYNNGYFSPIYARLSESSVDDILQMPFKLRNDIDVHKFSSDLNSVKSMLSNGSSQRWDRIILYFKKAATGNDLLKSMAPSGFQSAFSENEVRNKVADTLLVNLIKNRTLELTL